MAGAMPHGRDGKKTHWGEAERSYSLIITCLFLHQFMIIVGDPGAVSRAGRKGATKVFKHRRKSPWVPTLTGPFPNGQAITGSWLGTKNALYYCAQSANSISWVLFVSSYTTAIDSITACLTWDQALLFFFASLASFLTKADYREKGRGHDRSLRLFWLMHQRNARSQESFNLI